MTRPDSFYPTTAPPLYTTEDVEGLDKTVHARYFLLNSQWFIVEYDADTTLAFGYSVLNGDTMNSEWGYVSMTELAELRFNFNHEYNGVVTETVYQVHRDDEWVSKPAKQVEAIRHGMRARE